MKSILVTGGTGFFGKAILRHLKQYNIDDFDSIQILSRNPIEFKENHKGIISAKGISLIGGNILNRDSLPWENRYTHILHAATESTQGPRLKPLERYRQIHDGTINVLDLAITTGASHFLLTSSGGIYGEQPNHLDKIPENWVGSPSTNIASTAYSQAKRGAESLCTLYQDKFGLKTVIARCFAFIGEDLPLNAHFAIGNFVYDALYSEAITIKGDGTPIRSYLDQRDLAHWLWVLLHEGIAGEIYNIGSDNGMELKKVATLVRDLIAPHKRIIIKGKDTLTSSRNIYIPDISKICKLHKLAPTYSLSQSIKDTALLLQSRASESIVERINGIQ